MKWKRKCWIQWIWNVNAATIKAQSVLPDYKARNGETYHLNFIDTPGLPLTSPAKFSFVVGVRWCVVGGGCVPRREAQSVANCYTIDLNLEVVLVLNKIDLPAVNPGSRLQRN